MAYISYKDAQEQRKFLMLRKEKTLLEIATRLDVTMPSSFQEILNKNNAANLDNKAKIKVLNNEFTT